MDVGRDKTFCGDNNLFTPNYSSRDWLDTTDVYGNGMNKTMLENLSNFNANIEARRKSYEKRNYRGHS
jgi:hypothetical protein